MSGAAGTTSGDLTTIMVRIYGGRTASGTSAQTLTTTARGTSWTAKATAPLSNGQYTAQAEQDGQHVPPGSLRLPVRRTDTPVFARIVVRPDSADIHREVVARRTSDYRRDRRAVQNRFD